MISLAPRSHGPPPAVSRFGIVSFDAGNAEMEWSRATPYMAAQESLEEQCALVKALNPEVHCGVYRNMVTALADHSDVCRKLQDPQYWGWFGRLANASAGDGSLEQTLFLRRGCPGGPSGGPAGGQCECCAGVPCRGYIFDHRNESLRPFLVDTYFGGPHGLGSPNVDFFFIDDNWYCGVFHNPVNNYTWVC